MPLDWKSTPLRARRARGGPFIGKPALVASMFIAYLIGAGVAPFLSEGQRPNFVGGVLALYLLISGVMTARRRPFRAGTAERVGVVVAILITSMGILFAYLGANDPSGTIDGSPPQAFYLFTIVGSVALGGEINALVRGQLSEVARKMRHLWRMCVSFFIASGSLFLGQPQIFPEWFNASLLPAMLAFAPILVMLVVLSKIGAARFKSSFN